MAGKKKIGDKINRLLLLMVSTAMLVAGTISAYSLWSMKRISADSGKELGESAANDAEEALEDLAVDNLRRITVQKAAVIEEKFAAVETYVLSIAAQARDIYEQPEQYPDRKVALPIPESNQLAAQLIWSEKLKDTVDPETGIPMYTEEVLKLGNLQDMLVQYNANNSMVSSAYIATESGWMIQADYIPYSKYNTTDANADRNRQLLFEAQDRQWYKRAKEIGSGQVVYTDVIRDVHGGGDCIVCASPVYRGEKVVAVAGVGSYLETINNAVLGIDIGEGGYAFLVNEDGQVIVSGEPDGETAAYAEQIVDLRESSNMMLAQAAAGMVSGDTDSVELTLDGREVYLAYAPLKHLGWSLVTVLEEEKVIAPAKESQSAILALSDELDDKQDEAIRGVMLAFVVALVCVTLLVCISGTMFSMKLTEPICSLTEEVLSWDGSDFGQRISVKTGDEIEDLGEAFNDMIDQIEEYVENLSYVTTEKERIRTEIQVASGLQADMLPDAERMFTNREDFVLAASMIAAKGVGGDFYDFFLLDEERLALVIADVSGKGVPAALFMVVSRMMIRSRLMRLGRKERELSRAVEEVNRSLCDNNKDGMFVTAWIGVLNIANGEVDFVNAGHCRPLVIRKSGESEYDTTFSGMMLAGMEDTTYRQGKLKLGKGDMLLLYTDGVTEANDSQQNMYGEERLKKTVKEAGNMSPRELLAVLWKAVDDFCQEEPQFDDITMLAVTWRGGGFEEKTGIPVMENMQDFIDFVESALEERDVSVKTAVKIHVTVDEIFSNICYYSGATEVKLGISINDKEENGTIIGQKIILYFEDDGIPYDPLKRPDPDVTQMLGRRREGGLGIYMVKKRMDKVEYEYVDGRNRLTVYKLSEE
ncbi:MAG: SpoIIE family protein phosphatase [Lachnospiraceae bacterium]|nr:SpoIIE family protein phosphatase [Lachnospiraceae bacterium]